MRGESQNNNASLLINDEDDDDDIDLEDVTVETALVPRSSNNNNNNNNNNNIHNNNSHPDIIDDDLDGIARITLDDGFVRLRTIYCITWMDTIQACFLLAYYGQMYRLYGGNHTVFWGIKSTDSLWDVDLVEGATWFGIFVVHTFQLLVAMNLCSGTKQPGTENLKERIQTWYDTSKILLKLLVIECFILFMPNKRPHIFNWPVFTIKAIFRLIAIRYVFYFMEEDEVTLVGVGVGGREDMNNVAMFQTLFNPNNHHHIAATTTTSGLQNPQNGGGMDSMQHMHCSPISPDEEPPPSYQEATNCKDQNVLYLHV